MSSRQLELMSTCEKQQVKQRQGPKSRKGVTVHLWVRSLTECSGSSRCYQSMTSDGTRKWYKGPTHFCPTWVSSKGQPLLWNCPGCWQKLSTQCHYMMFFLPGLPPSPFPPLKMYTLKMYTLILRFISLENLSVHHLQIIFIFSQKETRLIFLLLS